ncbi:N-acetyl-D-glucosamine kinase [Anastrepha ludens]|uniref:N-acetyl-D-glucosamine kinase n=1 Tax=Anastrepha ludens TaxID=28586 RepID=UPI0023AF1663|nr:N-acetyl-D-glucosamine kinase [Anastrepha ludens]XP_053946806.1 N-acetyl-D-glucosamine kinase [Anastrepha ludens]
MKYFGGVEGGATHSRLVICDEQGNSLALTTGLGTNHWMVGIPEVARRITDMVQRAKEEAGIESEVRLASLGLSLSGCEQEATNQELEHEMRNTFPEIADSYVVCSDTMGSVFTASPIGGMVVISGTGSNALLRNPDGSTYTCGGWGHFMGDEGSAFYIAHEAMKIVFDDIDNLKKSRYPIDCVWELIKQHFNVDTRFDLLPHCYAKFDKPFYASLCKKLAHAADQDDALAKSIFNNAGRCIARSIAALIPKVQDELVKTGYLSVVCVGSVWHSWHLLREGFEHEMRQHDIPFDLRLVTITKSMAYGACYLAADAIEMRLPRNYLDNFDVMYHYHTKEKPTNGHSSNGCSSAESIVVRC